VVVVEGNCVPGFVTEVGTGLSVVYFVLEVVIGRSVGVLVVVLFGKYGIMGLSIVDDGRVEVI
jgi:hypothetical protein